MLPHALHELPIYSRCDEIVTTVRHHQTVIIAGETGCGKSTVLPLLCREAGLCAEEGQHIVVTQPRRISAAALAAYAASLDNAPLGATIGFQVRYRRLVGEHARIVYMTDGVLLALLSRDPALSRFGVIIIDEAHERSLNVDLLLGYLRTLLPRRPDLRCIIASATMDTQFFSRAFGAAPVVTIPVRRFAVDIRYRPVVELWKGRRLDSYVEGVLVAATEIIASEGPGDILAFMPTVDNVNETVRRLRATLREKNVTVLPLHSRLGAAAQREVFRSFGGRKIVVATNIAETSLTVPGIRFVIDSGLVRLLRYEPSASISRMPIEKISQASAAQRSGRCGRERDGICIRLYSENDMLSRPKYTRPEIKRANLAGALLRIAAMPLSQPHRFPFLQRPDEAAIHEGYRQLRELGAVDRNNRITMFGRAMARFPLDPPVACMLLRAKEFNAVEEVMTIAAALSAGEVTGGADGSATRRVLPGRNPESDFLTFCRVWESLCSTSGSATPSVQGIRSFAETYGLEPHRLHEWADVRAHIGRICRDLPDFARQPPAARASYEAIHKSLLSALATIIVFRKADGIYEGVSAGDIRISDVSVTARKPHQWLLVHEIVETDRRYAARAAVIDPKWVEDLFAHRCTYRHEDPFFDAASGKVMVRQEVAYGSLTLIRNRVVECGTVDRAMARETFMREALVNEQAGDGRFRFLRHNREVRASVLDAERKLRRPCFLGDDALEAFYNERVDAVSCRELAAAVRRAGGDAFLMVSAEHLLSCPLPADLNEYVDELQVLGRRIPVVWEHAEQSDSDGATLIVPHVIADMLPQYYWEWQLPVFRKARIALLVSRLTHEIVHAGLDPAAIEERLNGLPWVADGPFLETVLGMIDEMWNVGACGTLQGIELPRHLFVMVRAVDESGVVVDSFRPPFSRCKPSPRRNFLVPLRWLSAANDSAAVHHAGNDERLPALQVPDVSPAGAAVPLWRAFHLSGAAVTVGTFTSRIAAFTAHAEAVAHLVEEQLAEPLAWAVESVKVPLRLQQAADRCGYTGDLSGIIARLVVRNVVVLDGELPANYPEVAAQAEKASRGIAGLPRELGDALERIFEALFRISRYLDRQKIRFPGTYYQTLFDEFGREIDTCRSAITDENRPVDSIMRLHEFIDAMGPRISAALLDPALYRQKMAEVRDAYRTVETAAASGAFVVVRRRRELLEVIERYCIDQFCGAGKRGGVAVTGRMVAEAHARLNDALRLCYRE